MNISLLWLQHNCLASECTLASCIRTVVHCQGFNCTPVNVSTTLTHVVMCVNRLFALVRTRISLLYRRTTVRIFSLILLCKYFILVEAFSKRTWLFELFLFIKSTKCCEPTCFSFLVLRTTLCSCSDAQLKTLLIVATSNLELFESHVTQ